MVRRTLRLVLCLPLLAAVLLLTASAGAAQEPVSPQPGEMEQGSPVEPSVEAAGPARAGEWSTVAANPQRTSWVSEEVRGRLKPAWFKKIDPYISQKVQIIAANNTLYVSTAAGLYALDPTDTEDQGKIKWVYPTDMPLGNSPTVYGGVAYVGGYDRKLHAVDANTGEGLWTFTAGAGFAANPLVVEGTVYLGNRDGYFYAVSAATGRLRWKYLTGGPILYSAAYNDGTVFFASDDMHAYALDAATGSLKWKSDKLPGDGFHSYWPVIYKQFVVFSGSADYRFSVPPYPGPLKRLDLEDVYPNRATDPKGTPVCSTPTFDPQGEQPGDWAQGTPTLDVRCVTEYYESKPWRRTVYYLYQATGTEYSFDSDGDGKPEYAPFLSAGGTHSGNRYPPVVGGDGVIYQQNSYKSHPWIPGGGLTGWEPGTSIISLPSNNWTAVDEPTAVSGGGNLLYSKLMGERAAGAIDLSTPEQDGWSYYNSGGSQIKNLIPEVFLRDGKLWEFAYWKHGDQNPPVPYKGKLYMILNNAVVAFGQNDGAPRDAAIPVGKTTGEPAKSALKATTLSSAYAKVTADGNSWPSVVQQESYYSTQSAPGGRPSYLEHFTVGASSADKPAALEVSQDSGSAASLTVRFGRDGQLRALASPYAPSLLFETNGGMYDLRGSLVGVAYATPGGIKVLNGSATFAGSGMSEGWMLVWDSTDTHRWAPVLLSLQRRPTQVRLSPQGLRISYPGEAGYLSVTPFYGMSDPRSPEASVWQKGLPAAVVERSRLLARVSLSFPVATREQLSIDESSGDGTLTYSHSFLEIQDEWRTLPLKLAYLPPELALASWDGSPIRIDGKPLEQQRDLSYLVPLGRIAGVENADTVTVTLPGIARYWNGQASVSYSDTPGDPVRARLADEVEKMVVAGHLRPGYGNTGIWQNFARDRLGDNEIDYWHNPADTLYTLIRALPHLPISLQDQVRSYLQKEFADYPPYSIAHVGWKDGAPREGFDLPPEVEAARDSFPPAERSHWQAWDFPPQNFYALWLYADTFGGAGDILSESRSKLETPQYPMSMPYVLNSYLSGYLGYLHVLQLAGAGRDVAAEEQMVKLFITRAALFKYPESLRQAGFEYGGLKWAVNAYDPTLGEVLFRPAIVGSLWDQLPLYGFPLDSLYFGGGLRNGDGYSFTIDFVNLTPELAWFIRDYALKEAAAAIDDYTNNRAPYWFVSKAEETGGEGVFQPLFDKVAYFQAKAMILEEPRSSLEKYLDVPAFERGDLFFIQNLVSLLEAPMAPAPAASTQP